MHNLQPGSKCLPVNLSFSAIDASPISVQLCCTVMNFEKIVLTANWHFDLCLGYSCYSTWVPKRLTLITLSWFQKSRPPHSNQETGNMKESGVYTDIMFVSNHKTSEGAERSECPFDFVSPGVSVFHSTVLFPFVLSIFPIRGQQSYPLFFEPLPERNTVISLVRDDSVRPCFWTSLIPRLRTLI